MRQTLIALWVSRNDSKHTMTPIPIDTIEAWQKQAEDGENELAKEIITAIKEIVTAIIEHGLTDIRDDEDDDWDME